MTHLGGRRRRRHRGVIDGTGEGEGAEERGGDGGEERKKSARDKYHGEGRDDTGGGVGPRHHGHLHVLVP